MSPRKDLQTHTLLSKYSRFLPAEKRRETHAEANKRTIDMHRRKFGSAHDDTFSWLLDQLNAEKILGSQRSLQFAGPAIERINARMFNCSASFFDRPRFLAEAVWLLLCGCGVGFSVQKHHVAKLPRLRGPRGRRKHFVEDSIEGWADAFDALLNSYIHGAARIDFVYDRVRPEGAALSTSSAKAPGPKPLELALENVRRVLDRVVYEQDGVIRPIDAYDMTMHAAMCVRAGGIRRSATICIFSPDDVEMAQAKTGNWFAENPQRRLSNNSAMLVRSTVPREEFSALMASTKQFGEPGFYFSDSTEHMPNPCVEIGLDPVDHETGETTFAFCNVTSVNCAGLKDESDLWDRVAAAATLGTYQAAYTDFGYLGAAAKRVAERDALLGVSLTGMADAPSWIFEPEVLREAALCAVETNWYVAGKLGINTAARVTTVKPEGTGSLLLGVGNGIHPHHSRRYLRHVEGGKWSDPIVRFLLQVIPQAVVQSAYNEAEVKLVFPIDLGDGPLWLKAETEALNHLAKVATVQKQWVQTGRTRDDLSHNVSNTVVVKPHEWDDVEDYIWTNRDVFAGVSLGGSFLDLDYLQAPFVEVLSEDEAVAKYGDDPVRLEKAREVKRIFDDLVAAWPKGGIPWHEFTEDEDASAGTEVVACAGGNCSF